MTSIMALDSISKRYGPTTALDAITVSIAPRRVIGLVGENGAGKSTLLKVMAGLVQPDEGTLEVRGTDVTLASVRDASDAGIGLVSQEQAVIANLSAAENIALGSESVVTPGPWYRWNRVRSWATRWLGQAGSTVDPASPAGDLSFQDRQGIEIAKALSARQRGADGIGMILLDEPTTVLDGDQIEHLFDLIDRLKQDASIVFVSHRLDEVLRVSDEVLVMRDGRLVAHLDVDEADSAQLYRLMVGEDSSQSVPDKALPGSDVRLELRSLAGLGFESIDLAVRAGEILGIAGVQGSGKESLCRTIYGASPTMAGSISIDGSPIDMRTPNVAARSGVGYLSADRRQEGSSTSLSVLDNMLATRADAYQRFGVLDRHRARRDADDLVARLRIKTPGLDAPMGTLSGGNQQKVLIARWLMGGDVSVLLLDHPTRGVDLAATRDVHDVIRDLAGQGIAMVLLADSLDELLALSHRIIVMKDGVVTAEHDAVDDPPTPVQLVAEMV